MSNLIIEHKIKSFRQCTLQIADLQNRITYLFYDYDDLMNSQHVKYLRDKIPQYEYKIVEYVQCVKLSR